MYVSMKWVVMDFHIFFSSPGSVWYWIDGRSFTRPVESQMNNNERRTTFFPTMKIQVKNTMTVTNHPFHNCPPQFFLLLLILAHIGRLSPLTEIRAADDNAGVLYVWKHWFLYIMGRSQSETLSSLLAKRRKLAETCTWLYENSGKWWCCLCLD